MDKNLQNIEDLFYSALNEVEVEPSQNYWEAMDREFGKHKIISIKSGYTNLKRIALLLLLLLISFSLFEINSIQHNQRLAKKNEIHSDKLSKSAIINNKGLSGKVTNDSAIAMGAIHISGYKKENAVGKNLISAYNGKNLPSGTSPNDNYDQHRKKNILGIPISEKSVPEPSKNHTPGYKENPTRQLAYLDRIKNSKGIEDEKLGVENNGEKIENRIIENIKLQLKDSVNAKKSINLKIVFDSNVDNKSNNVLTKRNNEVKASAFSIMPFFSPDVAWYRLQNDNLNNQFNNAGEFESEEKHEFSSTYGILVGYNLNKRWGIQTGITLSNINITINPETLYAQPDNTGNIKYRINTSSGYGFVLPSFSSNPVMGDSLYAFTSLHSLQYIGVPIAATYNFTLGKFNLNVVEGISANLLSKSKLETTVENGFQNSSESINKIQGLKNIYFSGLTGLNVDLRLEKRTTISITPTIRYALNSINKNTPVKSYPMSFGSVVGVKIGL
ncbi:MAG: hypothetical protein KGM16_17170 [Bacteroidota bacterium]|nr:hypothetical protein [Bacteroidota bacterium]